MDSPLIASLAAPDASSRLKAALAAGMSPQSALLDTLLERCAVEPDFYVRDMLTWALTRLPVSLTVPRLIAQLSSPGSQARSQALHTLSKVRDVAAWPAITQALLHDADEEVARSAWRAAVVLVPDEDRAALAAQLGTQLGRGDRSLQLSLSRALGALGEGVVEPVLRRASASADPSVLAHANVTQQLLRNPDADFVTAIEAAKRIYALGRD